MPPKRKGAAAKVAQADAMEDKAAEIGDQPKVKKGRPAKEEEAPVAEEKPKRGRGAKAAAKENNVVVEESKPKGRGKKAAAEKAESNDEEDSEEEAAPEEPKRRGRPPAAEKVDTNGVKRDTKTKKGKPSKEEVKAAKDAAKAAKEEAKVAKAAAKNKKSAKSGKDEEEDVEDDVEDKPEEEKPAGRGRGRAAKKPADKPEMGKDEDEDMEDDVEDKPEEEKPAGRGRGRAAKKPADKPEAGKDEDEEEDDVFKLPVEDQPEEGKPSGRGRGRPAKKPADKPDADEAPKAKKVRGGKKSADTESSEPALQNQTETDYSKLDFACEKQNANGDKANFKIASWNVDGLRAWVNKDGLQYIEKEDPDIICLQETKCSEDKVPDEVTGLENYKKFWVASEKGGYAGVALFTKKEPIEVKYGLDIEEHDDEGRCITAEYETFYLICVYVPNAGRKLVTLPKRLEWNKAFKDYVLDLDKKKPVIICGDMNVAHEEIDLANPKTNKKNAGFTEEEREGMTDFLEEGFVDTFRKFYPEQKDAYTFWTYLMKARSKNVGWRLDYFLLSERLMDSVCDSVIRSEVFGSDHCPIALFLTV